MSKAYSYEIKNKIDNEYQASPDWVITLVRWSNRDTFRFNSSPDSEKGAPDQLDTRDFMVIRNDCISVSTNSVKSSHTPEAQLTLKAGDINYMTAVAPGDFFFVNILKSEKEADVVADKAAKGKPINTISDGFKGFFKIQSVRQSLSVDAESGVKQLVFQIQGYAFTEFNNTIYFNPHLLEFGQKKNDFLFVSNFGSVWNQLVGNKLIQNVQNIVSILIDTAIGYGLQNQKNKAGNASFNTHFYIPQKVGRLLGVNNAKAAKDLIKKQLGVQVYSSGNIKRLQDGMQPKSISVCEGSSMIKAEYWNQVALWSIMQQYLNAPINEMFNCFRIQSDGSVLPTFVMRQIPFTTERYSGVSTKFLNLPRWKISPDQITSLNLGRDEAARINFVQVFGRIQGDNPDSLISEQIAKGNYDLDIADVQRSGLKPYIITSNSDSIHGNEALDKGVVRSPVWAKLLGDSLIGGHMKLNGTVVCLGVYEPICIGDNFELGNVVYHIESVTHQAQISADGRKVFSTSLQLSNGIDKNYSSEEVRYAANDNVDMLKERKEDFESDKLLAGISDSQSIPRLPNKDNTVSPENNGFNLQTKKNSYKKAKK